MGAPENYYVYSQSTGEMLDAAQGFTLGKGYSGALSAKNIPSQQEVRGIGPIPAGWYAIGDAYDDEHRGNFTLPLVPHPDNKMFGRSGFLIHADSILHPGTASAGCIIMSDIVRYALAKSNVRWLLVRPEGVEEPATPMPEWPPSVLKLVQSITGGV